MVLSLEELGFKKNLWALIFSQKEQPFVTILLEALSSFLIHVQIYVFFYLHLQIFQFFSCL